MEYMTSWLAILFEVECPQAESALIVPQGNSVSPGRHEISSPVDCPYCSMLSAPGEVNSHCAPGELGITSWLWNNYDQWTGPWGSQLPLCPRGILSPCSTVSFDYTPGKLNISSWMWNIITSGLAILFDAEYPWGSQLPLCPRGILSPCSTVSFDYTPEKLNISSWMWNTITRGLAILLNVECPRGIVHSHCAPGEFSMNSWPWSIITGRHHIVKCCVPPGKALLSLCPTGNQYHQLAMKYDKWTGDIVRGWVPPGSLLSLCPRGTQYQQFAMKYHHQWTGHIVQCWVPLGQSLLSLCPRGTQHHQLDIKLFKPEWPPERANCHCAPGEFVITRWLWNIITGWSLLNVECSWKSLLS